MNAFLDTNILIDLLARREQFYQAASNVVDLGISGSVTLFSTSMTFATTVFVCRKVLGYENTVRALQSLEAYIRIVPMDADQCHEALHSKMPDFEDMLQYEAALASDCDVIITRNSKHFPKGIIPILTPLEFLAMANS